MYLTVIKVKSNAIGGGNAAVGRSHGFGDKIVPLTIDFIPSGDQLTEFGIIIYTIDLNQSRVLHLAGAYAIVAEVVVELAGVVGSGDFLNTGQLHAVFVIGVVDPAVCDDSAVGIGFAVCPDTAVEVAAGAALEHIVGECVTMSGGGESGAPIDDGGADLAIGSAGVAVLCAGGRLVGKGDRINMVGRSLGIIFLCFRSVVVSTVPRGIVVRLRDVRPVMRFGIHLYLRAGKGVARVVGEGHSAANHCGTDVNGPYLVALLIFGIHPNLAVICAVCHESGKLPCSHGHGNKHSLAGGVCLAGAGNGDRGNIFGGIADGVGRLEAIGCDHVVEFPSAHVVQVDIGRNGLNLLNVRCNEVNVVDRAKQNIVKHCVMRHELNGGHAGACLNIDLADRRGIVALLITDSKFHGVNAVCKNAIGNGHDTVLKGAGDFNAVYIDLCRGLVQAGCVVFFFIGNRCAKGDCI